jgi:geranylgeranyl pyrophosphate synthase
MQTSTKGAGAEVVARYFASRRAMIAGALEALGDRDDGRAESVGRIVEFCLRGKMIRGCLVLLAAEAAGAEAASAEAAGAEAASAEAAGAGTVAAVPAKDDALARLAAAMELFQAGLLAHDDIMDRDETRRGAPTIHARYAAEATAVGSSDRLHVGESLGICLGDLCYFEGYALIARAIEGNPNGGAILALFSERLAEVAVAQMADVRWGASSAEVPESDILAMYRGKTAHYSFSLPLAAGALFAAGGARPPADGPAPADDLARRFTELGGAPGHPVPDPRRRARPLREPGAHRQGPGLRPPRGEEDFVPLAPPRRGPERRPAAPAEAFRGRHGRRAGGHRFHPQPGRGARCPALHR